MSKQSDVRQDSLVFLIYGEGGLEHEFKDELERVMSLSLSVESQEIPYSPLGLESQVFPHLLEIILIFASTTIATSVLSKIGEDVYNYFKREIIDNIKKIHV